MCQLRAISFIQVVRTATLIGFFIRELKEAINRPHGNANCFRAIAKKERSSRLLRPVKWKLHVESTKEGIFHRRD